MTQSLCNVKPDAAPEGLQVSDDAAWLNVVEVGATQKHCIPDKYN